MLDTRVTPSVGPEARVLRVETSINNRYDQCLSTLLVHLRRLLSQRGTPRGRLLFTLKKWTVILRKDTLATVKLGSTASLS